MLTKENKNGKNFMCPTPNSEYGYYRNWYECSQDTVFERKVFQEIKDYDSYLSFKFGNYMELPPVESRKVHPVSEIKSDIRNSEVSNFMIDIKMS